MNQPSKVRWRRQTCMCVLVFGCLQTPTIAQSPIALHAENPHYFSWGGHPIVLVTSGEHYGAVLNMDFDYVAYLDELQRHGLNLTRTFAGTYREIPSSFGITDNPLAPKSNRYLCPWARSDEPGYYDGGNKFDLRRWNPAYFQRLGDFLEQAERRGIVVELTLFCPFYNDQLWEANPMHCNNNVNGVGQCGRNEVFTLQHEDLTEIQLAVARRIVAETRNRSNVIIEICNEPYFGGVTRTWQDRIIEEIVRTERDGPNRHLISMNIANGRQPVIDPNPAVSVFNFHYCVPPDTVTLNYELNRVIGENETGFRGREDLLYRTEAWDFLLAGGGLFNNLDYSFTPRTPAGTLRDYHSPGGGSPELRQQLGYLKRYFASFEFWRCHPDTSWITSTDPELMHYALVEAGRTYAAYFHVPLPVKPKTLADHMRTDIRLMLQARLPRGRYSAVWLDPVNGRRTEALAVRAKESTTTLRSPSFDNDIALLLQRSD